jgi:hypothetical protein
MYIAICFNPAELSSGNFLHMNVSLVIGILYAIDSTGQSGVQSANQMLVS